jgi:hypothetical protein
MRLVTTASSSTLARFRTTSTPALDGSHRIQIVHGTDVLFLYDRRQVFHRQKNLKAIVHTKTLANQTSSQPCPDFGSLHLRLRRCINDRESAILRHGIWILLTRAHVGMQSFPIPLGDVSSPPRSRRLLLFHRMWILDQTTNAEKLNWGGRDTDLPRQALPYNSAHIAER